jgi:isorenieratene synthase
MAGMRPYLASAPSGPRDTAAARPRVVVAGGGIAGASAAVILAERGIPVVLCEAADRLGGRLGAHPRTLPDGTVQWVDHGFHGFFRQYYNWRQILRRISPGPAPLLHPLGSYPVVSARWPDEEFDRLPPAPPLSILALTLRSPSLRLRELARADHAVGLSLLGFDADRTYAHLDQLSAEQLLAALRLPEHARVMLFNVFAHSFFNDAAVMSAAELVAMFHFFSSPTPKASAWTHRMPTTPAPSGRRCAAIWSSGERRSGPARRSPRSTAAGPGPGASTPVPAEC